MDALPDEILLAIIGRDRNDNWCRYIPHWDCMKWLRKFRTISKRYHDFLEPFHTYFVMYCQFCKSTHRVANFNWEYGKNKTKKK